MKVVILDVSDNILAEHGFDDGDFTFFGSGAITVTMDAPGRLSHLLLAEDDGKVIGEGAFHRDIMVDKEVVMEGDKIIIKLSID